MRANGTPARLDTYIDIPLEIGLPHFISDDRMQENGPLFGNFKLSLQSLVCHRGASVDSGHYIALVRGTASNATSSAQGSRPSTGNGAERADAWLRFDDLAKERVTYVDIAQALKEESPYLLFYQVQPIDEDLIARGEPPPYSETITTSNSASGTADQSTDVLPESTAATTVDVTDWESGQGSLDLTLGPIDSGGDQPRGRSSTSSAIHEANFSDDPTGSVPDSTTGSFKGQIDPPTPAEEGKSGFLAASRRGSKASKKGSKSRPSSQSGESRLSFSMSRITARMSRDKLTTAGGEAATPNVVAAAASAGTPVPPTVNEVASQSVETSVPKNGTGPFRTKSKKEKKRRSINNPLTDPKKNKTEAPERECTVM